MRAVVFADGGRVEVADVAAPVIERPTDAIVRVTRAAICGTDLHLLHGKAPIEPGAVLGHEAVGVVESIGDDATPRRTSASGRSSQASQPNSAAEASRMAPSRACAGAG